MLNFPTRCAQRSEADSRHLELRAIVLMGLLTFALSRPAIAELWTVTNLHPPGTVQSTAYAGRGGQQVGYTRLEPAHSYRFHAGYWNGSAGSWVDLHPGSSGPFSSSIAYAVDNEKQVGAAFCGGDSCNAGYWTGTAASWVNLAPPGSFDSQALGAGDGQQVGYNYSFSGFVASLWTGTASSWVNLSPAVASSSTAYDADNGQQVGYVTIGDQHASLWSGTAASWVDLNPSGMERSVAYGIDGNHQVGFASVNSNFESARAGLWSETAESWVDLHPDAATNSVAYDILGGMQVGSARIGGLNHAGLWSGTPESWVDLSSFLPLGFTNSVARSIWIDGSYTYVAGYAYNNATGYPEAVLWTQPIPDPGAATLLALGCILMIHRRRPEPREKKL